MTRHTLDKNQFIITSVSGIAVGGIVPCPRSLAPRLRASDFVDDDGQPIVSSVLPSFKVSALTTLATAPILILLRPIPRPQFPLIHINLIKHLTTTATGSLQLLRAPATAATSRTTSAQSASSRHQSRPPPHPLTPHPTTQ